MTNKSLINAHQLPSSRNIDEQDQVNSLAAHITLSQSQLKNIEALTKSLVLKMKDSMETKSVFQNFLIKYDL